MTGRRVAAGFAAVLAISTAWVILSVSRGWTEVPAATTPAIYKPSMSDFMNETIQPRHIKLWLAVRSRNWGYATYELSELKGAFGRLGKTIPVYRKLPIADMIAGTVEAPLGDLEKAAEAKDSAAFTKAYGALTDGCNGCHRSAQHSMVVIKVPAENPFPDQDFHAVP